MEELEEYDDLYRHTVDGGNVDVRIWKDGDFKCRLFGLSYGESYIISTLLSGCGYTVTSNDGMSKKHYDDFWTEEDSEKILNAVYPNRIKNKEDCDRTRKRYTKAREEHRIRKEKIEAYWAEKNKKQSNDGLNDDLPFNK